MSLRKLVPVVVLLAVSLASQPIIGQTQPQPAQESATTLPEGGALRYIRPETPEQRMARMGTAEDPGPNPDGETIWWRFGKKYKIERFDMQWAKFDAPEGWVRPWAYANFAKELYQMNDKYVWVWIEQRDPVVIAPEDDTTKFRKFSDSDIKFFEGIRSEFNERTPESANMTIRFEDSSNGLPTSGSWRNAPAVADMNEDGHVDLVLPPERGIGGSPSIYLGDSKGGWKYWDIEWPTGFNYGSVVAADFNKDKHMDLAFAVHLTGVSVFLGDGKGGFSEVTEGLAGDYPTRRLITTDLDRDGATDIVVISEGPMTRGGEDSKKFGSIRGFLNRKKGQAWEGFDIAAKGKYVGGDWLASGNFNGDRLPDFIGASVYFNGRDTLYLSQDAKAWDSVSSSTLIPFISYYFALTAGKFTTSKLDDAVVSYIRQWPTDLSPKLVPTPPVPTIVGIDRITFDGKEPKRVSIARWSSSRAVWGMGRGDFDGDKNLDIAYSVFDPRELVLLLGDGAGNFKRANLEGIALPPQINYDVTVADLNRDSKPDLVIMYESDERSAFESKNGSVQVFLNRGVAAAKSGS